MITWDITLYIANFSMITGCAMQTKEINLPLKIG